jgi:transcriptional regulator with XRE-family HTH domain
MKAQNAKQVLNFCVQEYTKSTLNKPWDRPVAITEKLSIRSGCTTNSITNWLRGDNEPRFNNLLALVEVCGYDLVLIKKEKK